MFVRDQQTLDQIYADINAASNVEADRWGGSEKDHHHSVEDWTAFIVKHLGLGVAWPINPVRFRAQLVKAAGLIVVALEWVDRNWPEARNSKES